MGVVSAGSRASVGSAVATLCTLGLVSVAAMIAAGCDSSSRPRPNVILITIDTLRADRLSCYGHTRETTPFLDQLARDGIRFSRAYSNASWTAPAVVSLLTGLLPTTHGVEHGIIENRTDVVNQEIVPGEARMWAEVLQRAGYRSFGITANGHLDPRFGFDRGFERYRCIGFADAAGVKQVLASWQQEIVESHPYFLWVHLFDPHAPYRFHPSAMRDYHPQFRRIPKKVRDRLQKELVPEYLKLAKVTEGSERFRYVNALYDGEVRYTDTVIQEIFEVLPVSSRDLVFVTSDHGEEFLEHQKFGHGNTLYEEVVKVPLIVRLPDAESAGVVVDRAVSLVDLLPSVLDYLGIAIPVELQGQSFLPLLRGGDSSPRFILTSLSRFPALKTKSLTLGSWKYVHHYADPEQTGLFELSRDPGEQRNLLHRRIELAESLERLLFELETQAQQRRLKPGTQVLTPEEVERLKALGYLE
jgi:arylsulfatase A-like enzyme